LESIGRLGFVATPADFGSIEITRAARLPVLSQNPQLGDELLAEIRSRLNRADGARTERR
jgi:hypothetical protein